MSQIRDRLDPTKKYQLVTAGVQSGKTNEMLEYCLWTLVDIKKDVIFILQNSKADREQLIRRIKQHPHAEQLTYAVPNGKNVTMSPTKFGATESPCRIILCLGNARSLMNAYQIAKARKRGFHICLDEADLSIKTKSGDSKFETAYKEIRTHADHTLGVTATSIAVHLKEEKLDSVINLEAPEDYTGIENIHIRTLDLGVGLEDTWETVYRTRFRKPTEDRVILHVEARIIKYQDKLAESLAEKFPEYLIVTYNGNGVTLFTYEKSTLVDESLVTKTVLKADGISQALQQLYAMKPPGERKISIIAGGMATRGISYVSSDYKIHLTDQIFVPSECAHGENIIQSLRLLGRYVDSNKPTLWTYPHVVNRIKNQYRIIKQFNQQKERNIASEVQFDTPHIDMCRPGVMEDFKTEVAGHNTRTLAI